MLGFFYTYTYICNMESLLKKDFQEKDIQRARSLISGQYGNSTQVLVGYETVCTEHNEGDVWEQDGKWWKIEDGVRISISKLNRARQLTKMPLVCPKCGKPMKTRLDKKMYPIHHMCFECVTRMEDDLKRTGLYKDYEKAMVSNNMRSFVDDLKARIEVMKTDLKVDLVTEDGTVEDWGKISTGLQDVFQKWADTFTEQIGN